MRTRKKGSGRRPKNAREGEEGPQKSRGSSAEAERSKSKSKKYVSKKSLLTQSLMLPQTETERKSEKKKADLETTKTPALSKKDAKLVKKREAQEKIVEIKEVKIMKKKRLSGEAQTTQEGIEKLMKYVKVEKNSETQQGSGLA